MQETQVRSLGQKDPREKETATRPSILVWETPWTGESGGLHSPWSRKEWDMTEYTHTHTHTACLASTDSPSAEDSTPARQWGMWRVSPAVWASNKQSSGLCVSVQLPARWSAQGRLVLLTPVLTDGFCAHKEGSFYIYQTKSLHSH